MSKTKHTPGPWKVINGFDENGKGDYFPTVVIAENTRFGDAKIIVNASHDQEADSIMANARLISLAPEMLEALKEAYQIIDQKIYVQLMREGKDDDYIQRTINEVPILKTIKSLISKAEQS